jgi:hypothetical protein
MSKKRQFNEQVYRIVRFQMVDIEDLQPHEAALLPIEQGDREAIANSVKEVGAVEQPLLVIDDGDGISPRHQIVDGINRWEAAKFAGLTAVPCMVIETSDPRGVALTSLATRRQCSTGQRVMAFIEAHREECMAVSDEVEKSKVATLLRGRRKPQNINVSPRSSKDDHGRQKGLTVKEIAARLGVSDKDVTAGLSMLREMELPQDDQRRLQVVEMHREVLSGKIRLRTWKPAMEGRFAKQHGQKDADHFRSALRAMDALKKSFQNWDKITPDGRAQLGKIWHEEIVPLLPVSLETHDPA